MMMTHICDMYSAYTPCEDYLPVNQKFSIRAFTAFDDRKTDYSCTTTYYFRFMWKELSKFIHSFIQIVKLKKKRCSVKKNSLLNHWYDCSRGKEHWNANFTIVLFCAFLSLAIFRQIKYHHRQSTYDARTILILLMSCSHVFVSLQKKKNEYKKASNRALIFCVRT